MRFEADTTMDQQYTPTIKSIGAALKALRIQKGYTSYRNFADEYDLEPKQYWRLEEGNVDFRMSSLIKILKIHQIDIKDFINSVEF